MPPHLGVSSRFPTWLHGLGEVCTLPMPPEATTGWAHCKRESVWSLNEFLSVHAQSHVRREVCCSLCFLVCTIYCGATEDLHIVQCTDLQRTDLITDPLNILICSLKWPCISTCISERAFQCSHICTHIRVHIWLELDLNHTSIMIWGELTCWKYWLFEHDVFTRWVFFS